MANQSAYKNKQIFVRLFFLLLLDIGVFTIFGETTIDSLLCFYAVILFRHSTIATLLISLFFISLKHFLYFSKPIVPFLCLLLLSYLGSKTQKYLHKTTFLPHLFIILFLALEGFMIEPHLFGVTASFGCTFYKICVNLLLVAMFLKYSPKGKLGDHL